jgi:hypothetical protein
MSPSMNIEGSQESIDFEQYSLSQSANLINNELPIQKEETKYSVI